MARYKTRGDAIKDLRKRAGYSQEELASLLETTKQTIYKYETGIVTNIPSDKIEAMANIFHVSPAIIMGWDETIGTPVYEAAAGEGVLNEGYPSDEVRGILLDPDQFFATVHGRSMEPTLTDGDLVVIAASNVVDSPDQIALVKINGDEATLKHVEIREDGIVLIGDNVADYKPHFYSKEQVQQLPVTIEGVVVKLIREF